MEAPLPNTGGAAPALADLAAVAEAAELLVRAEKVNLDADLAKADSEVFRMLAPCLPVDLVKAPSDPPEWMDMHFLVVEQVPMSVVDCRRLSRLCITFMID
mmetsp:Transcript_22023/g.58690  ORF Transcript_22023/g.58690 Transcript_22023/m.58690 type:complete len:101 (-) Transcript_22023:107-409(-)